MAFDRRTELYVGVFESGNIPTETDAGMDKYEKTKQSGYLIDGLDYEFDITRSSEYYKDTATFTIYNPNDETVSEIMSGGCSVIFRAGYADEELGTIFVGQIAMAYPEDDGPSTRKLVLICKSQRGAQYPLQRTYITALIEEGRTYYDVLKAIADYVGIALTGAEPLKKRTLDSAYLISGDIRSEVTNFVQNRLRAIGGSVIISNNELIYFEKNNIVFSTVYLNYNSGLVTAKAVRDETYQSTEDAFNENREYYLGLAASGDPEVAKQKTIESQVQPKNVVEFECLLHPGLHVLTPVYIDARRSEKDRLSVLGKFYVTELHYQGGTYPGSQFSITGRAEEYTIGMSPADKP